jgi:hypothetical protein
MARIAVPAILEPPREERWALMAIPDLAASSGPVEFGRGLTLPAYVRDWPQREETTDEVEEVARIILESVPPTISRRANQHIHEAQKLFRRLAREIEEQRAKLVSVDQRHAGGLQAVSELRSGAGDDRALEGGDRSMGVPATSAAQQPSVLGVQNIDRRPDAEALAEAVSNYLPASANPFLQGLKADEDALISRRLHLIDLAFDILIEGCEGGRLEAQDRCKRFLDRLNVGAQALLDAKFDVAGQPSDHTLQDPASGGQDLDLPMEGGDCPPQRLNLGAQLLNFIHRLPLRFGFGREAKHG